MTKTINNAIESSKTGLFSQIGRFKKRLYEESVVNTPQKRSHVEGVTPQQDYLGSTPPIPLSYQFSQPAQEQVEAVIDDDDLNDEGDDDSSRLIIVYSSSTQHNLAFTCCIYI